MQLERLLVQRSWACPACVYGRSNIQSSENFSRAVSRRPCQNAHSTPALHQLSLHTSINFNDLAAVDPSTEFVMKRAFAELAPRAARGLQTPQARAVLVTLPSVQATQWQAVAQLHQLHSLQTHYLNRTLPTALGASMQQKRSMFIQTQPTPNPSSMMFLPGKTVMESGSMQFGNARESMKSPLAKKLFQVDGVTSVFFGSDFVTVTKSEDYTWNVIKPDIFAGIMDHFTSGDPLISDTDSTSRSDTAINDDDSEVVAMIKELLETRIRPAVMEDGGDIVFKGFDEPSGIVTLKMQGACSGCPSSSVTLKGGIENMLMHYIPEVKSVVEAEPDESEVAGMTEFNKLEQHLSA